MREAVITAGERLSRIPGYDGQYPLAPSADPDAGRSGSAEGRVRDAVRGR